MFTTMEELENIKAEAAKEQMLKNKENMKQLVQLLKFAIQERDEARNQLQKFLNKSTPIENFPNVPLFHADSPVMKQGKANSGLTDSDSISATYNYHSHGSSPVDPFLETVTSPDFSNMHLFSQETAPIMGPKFDEESLIIDNIAKGRVLPQKGKFLQAVLGAGPLLQTLLLAGPLPRWRNPPQLQPFPIPPVSIKGCEADFYAKQGPSVGNMASMSLNAQTYAQMSCASASAPMLNFGNMASANGLSHGSMISSGISGSGYVPLAKRQRFC